MGSTFVISLLLTPFICIINWVLFFAGCAMIYISITNSLPTVVLAIAISITAMSLFGCWGVLITRLIPTFTTLLFILVMVQLAVNVYVIMNKDSYEDEIKAVYRHIYRPSINPSAPIHAMQRENDCCGIISYVDWRSQIGFISGSCCGINSTLECDREKVINKQGCDKFIQEQWKTLWLYIPYAPIILIILEIMLLGCMVSHWLSPILDSHSRNLQVATVSTDVEKNENGEKDEDVGKTENAEKNEKEENS